MQMPLTAGALGDICFSEPNSGRAFRRNPTRFRFQRVAFSYVYSSSSPNFTDGSPSYR
jgi:hypothetical protein